MNGIPTALPQPAQRPQEQQPQGMPPQNDPRMSAAMNVVESNIPEYLNPTDALMKRNQAAELAQQAMALMASADRQTAMSQQPPTPPTIAEQVDQRAMEGISGIAQRLAPGMQQRGRQVQQAQARKMIGGGMPSMGAPNMARMADGGIVGYQEGGFMGPPEANMLQRMGQGLKNYGANAQESMGILKEAKAGMGVPYEERSAVMKQVRDEIAAQNQNRDPNFIERMGQKLMGVGLDVEESKAILKKFYNTFGKTYEEMSNGMAMGGEVKRFQAGMEVEADNNMSYADVIAATNADTTSTMPGVSSYIEAGGERRAAIAEVQKLVDRGVPLDKAITAVTSKRTRNENPADLGGIAALTNANRQPRPEFRMQGVNAPTPRTISATEFLPEGSTAEGGNAADNTTRQELFNELATIGDAQTETPRTNLVTPEVEERMQTAAAADPTALAEAAEKRRAALAQTAYGIPQALLDAYTARQTSVDEANAAMNDPKKQSRDEQRAMLSGFATPGGIARSGIAAGQGVAGVQEAAIQRKKDQGEEAFGITKELADLQRAASIEAYKSGEQGYDRAYRSAATAANASFQALSNIDIGAQNRANANRLADRSAKLETINMQLRSLENQDNMKSRDRNTQVTILNGAQRDASSIRGEIQKAIAESSFLSEAKRRPYLDYIAARQAELRATQSRIDAVAATLGIQTTSPAASGAGTGSTDLPAGFVPD